MDLRSYTKQELALLYFPDATPAVASAHLMRWIQRIPDLLQKLAATLLRQELQGVHPDASLLHSLLPR